MNGRRDSAVRVPSGALALLALDAFQRYAATGLFQPGDLLFPALVDRVLGGE